jgi:predicted esterase
MKTEDLDFIHAYQKVDGAKKTLVLLHGTGGGEKEFFPLAEIIAPNASLLGVRGKVIENGMPRYFQRYALGVFNQQDIRERAYELNNFVGMASRVYGFDKENVCVMGFSNGANMAVNMLMLYPGLFKQAMLFRAMITLQVYDIPVLKNTEILMSAGENDPVVPVGNTEALYKLFQNAGAKVDLHWQNSEHALTEADILLAQEWWSKYNK